MRCDFVSRQACAPPPRRAAAVCWCSRAVRACECTARVGAWPSWGGRRSCSVRRRWQWRLRAYGAVSGAGRWRRVITERALADTPGCLLIWRARRRRRAPSGAAEAAVLSARRRFGSCVGGVGSDTRVRSCRVLARSARDCGLVEHARRDPRHTHTTEPRAVTSPPAAPPRPIAPGKRRRSSRCVRVLFYGPVGLGYVS